jgi:hypothetical protein
MCFWPYSNDRIEAEALADIQDAAGSVIIEAVTFSIES